MKIFQDDGNVNQSAYFGWQDKNMAIQGLKEGYKNSADTLVAAAIEDGCPKTLDTYIFPILFLYRHCLELSLKLIYLRCYGEIPKNSHDLLVLWKIVKEKVIDSFINNPSAIEQVKKDKSKFIKYNFNEINFDEIELSMKKLQNLDKENLDEKATVWRYLIGTDGELFFTNEKSVNYLSIQKSFSYLYDVFDYIYDITSDYL